MWPLLWQAACGAQGVRLVGERDLVDCPDCRLVLVKAEILGRRPDAAATVNVQRLSGGQR